MTPADSVLPNPLTCIAHRGGRGNFTENTLEAVQSALKLGVDAIEIDVWQIQGQWLVTHDRRLGNTLPGEGLLLEQSPEHLKSLPLKNGGQLATLEQILSAVGDQCRLNLEMKGPDCAEGLANLLLSHCRDHQLAPDQFIVSSFDHQQLFRFKQHFQAVPLGVLIEGIPINLAETCSTLEAHYLNAGIYFVNQDLIEDAHRRGAQVWVYTANYSDEWAWLSTIGVDGVFTDEPEQLLAWNQGLQTSHPAP